MAYYSDLSAAASSEGEDESDEDGDFGLVPQRASSAKEGNKKVPARRGIMDDNNEHDTSTNNGNHGVSLSPQLDNVILHLDIDCFYCQCEHLDRKLPSSRPLAIGQKHIIVTSNYAARATGVKKLQLREDAYKACPNLLIVEGSDLERYRKHGRKVYEALRECVQTKCAATSTPTGMHPLPAISRGRGMDEMHADLTNHAAAIVHNAERNVQINSKEKPIYIYGEHQETTTLTEDQTGAQTTAQAYNLSMDHNPDLSISSEAKAMCQKLLLAAAEELGRGIQEHILERTGFTTTLGISTNPLLAKLASDLNKPSSVNVLYPWRAPPLIASMPLRKIPDAGHRTIKLLNPALEAFHYSGTQRESKKTDFWTCQDLLSLPVSEVKRVLENDEKCTMLLRRCKGVDTTTIVDDRGEAPKTVSCENSFRRGTVLTPEAVWKGLDDLYVRLPRLLKDRREWSKQPTRAYPTTIRLTARVVDKKLLVGTSKQRRRPFVTRSKQIPFTGGRDILDETDAIRQKAIVQNTIRPLVLSLVLNAVKPEDLNVTRLNIAVTNFQDVTNPADTKMMFPQGGNSPGLTQQSLTMDHFTSPGRASQSKPSFLSQKRVQTNSSSRHPASSLELAFKKQRQDQPSKPDRTRSTAPRVSPSRNNATNLPSGLDPATLAELPPEMVKDIIRDYNDVVSNRDSKQNKPKSKAKAARIDRFFARRT